MKRKPKKPLTNKEKALYELLYEIKSILVDLPEVPFKFHLQEKWKDYEKAEK